MSTATDARVERTCPVCGRAVPVVNYAVERGREVGYLGRHWRPGIARENKCRGLVRVLGREEGEPPMSEQPLPGVVEYHRHASGDVVQGAAERCIDPDAGAHDVVALTPGEMRERMEQAWDEGYRSGFSNAMRRMSDEPDAPTTPNPYRVAGDES